MLQTITFVRLATLRQESLQVKNRAPKNGRPNQEESRITTWQLKKLIHVERLTVLKAHLMPRLLFF